jgi:uncharacterized damage-inducible protein DinB
MAVMKFTNLRFAMLPLLLAVGLAAAVPMVRAEDAAPPAGYRGDMLKGIQRAQSELEQLAAAMPENKYDWRPAKGVRSVGEVYMHVAAGNYGLTALAGATPPAGFDMDKYEKSLTKKADIQKALHDSFEHAESAFTNASEADLDKQYDFMGNKMSGRGIYMLVLSHGHEHLGQSIAYARMNGVTPPWTAKQDADRKAMMDKMKTGTK